MAGHSQFKNIMHRKGRQDAAKSKLFGKLAREITVSAKIGLPDPTMNPRLRAAIIAARAENMPKDNIERAIKKATGGEGENYEQIRYEGYGPGGVAVIVEVLTDNRNRTAGEVRSTFTKSGGNLAETGAVSFMFDHVGVIEYAAKVTNPEAMFEAALEAGADDVVSSAEGHEIYAGLDRFGWVAKALTDGHIFTTISQGRGRMPSYKRIPADDRWDIVNYVRTLSAQPAPAPPQTAQAASGSRPKRISQAAGSMPSVFTYSATWIAAIRDCGPRSCARMSPDPV